MHTVVDEIKSSAGDGGKRQGRQARLATIFELIIDKMKPGSAEDRSSKGFSVLAKAVAPLTGGRLVPEMLTLFRALWASPQRNKIVGLGVGLVAVVGATAFGQIRLNAWNRPFYDAISRKDLREFLSQLGAFGVIAGGLLVGVTGAMEPKAALRCSVLWTALTPRV